MAIDSENQSDTTFEFTYVGLKKLSVTAGQRQVWDTKQEGLSLLVSYGGTKTFRSQFKLNGTWHRRSIGRFEENSLDRKQTIVTAREQVRLDRTLAYLGKDPRGPVANKLTVREAIDRFINERCKHTQKSWDQTQGSLMRGCADWLDKPVTSITRADLRALHQKYLAEGRTSSLMQAHSWIKSMWNWLLEVDAIEEDTLAPVTLRMAKPKRDKVYSDAELVVLWNASNKLDYYEKPYVRLMMLLAPRKTALALMKWEDLDAGLTVWTTPADLVKQKKTAHQREYKTPLPELARRQLEGLGPRNQDRVFRELPVKETTAGRRVFASQNLEYDLKKAGFSKVNWHRLRHTLATWLQNNGYEEYDAKLVLNHAGTGVTAGYQHGHALDRKLAVLNDWAAHIQSLLQPGRRKLTNKVS